MLCWGREEGGSESFLSNEAHTSYEANFRHGLSGESWATNIFTNRVTAPGLDWKLDVPRELGPKARTPQGNAPRRADQLGWAPALSQTAPGRLGTDQGAGGGGHLLRYPHAFLFGTRAGQSQPAPGKDKLLLAPPAALGPERGRSGEGAVGPRKVGVVKVLLPSAKEPDPAARRGEASQGEDWLGMDGWWATSLC